jgi:hypothetical protein
MKKLWTFIKDQVELFCLWQEAWDEATDHLIRGHNVLWRTDIDLLAGLHWLHNVQSLP